MKKQTNAELQAATCDTPMPLASVQSAIDRLSGKWTLRVLFALWERPHRFGELRKAVPGVTKNMLTQTLRHLEREGLVHREVVAAVPPEVTYSLTAEGARLRPVFSAIIDWSADRHDSASRTTELSRPR
jgi:DNA-binding HxlR family transcriptional regulator